MKFSQVDLSCITVSLPDEWMTSEEVESQLKNVYSRLKLPHGRLELMTGIKKRYFWPKGTPPSSIASMAAVKLLEKTSIDKNEIDLLINASVCRDFLEPATASVVHHHLNLSSHCGFFDLSNACLGVLNAMMLGAQLIESQKMKRVLIVAGENGGPLLFETIDFLNQNHHLSRKEIKKYIANLTIGSAGVAVLLSHRSLSRPGQKHKLLGGIGMNDTSANKLCQGDGRPDQLMMETDSESLLKAGLQLAQKNWTAFKDYMRWENSDIDRIITHQVGVAHQKGLYEKLDMEIKKDFSSFENLGNTGSAAVMSTLAECEEQNKLMKGNHIALLGIGSGLSSLMLGVEW